MIFALLLVLANCAFVYSRTIALEECNAGLCSRIGATGLCTFSEDSLSSTITCRQFSKTERSSQQCEFACIQICLPPEEQPIANNGERFCSDCHLRSASCASHYEIYFAPPTPTFTPIPLPFPLPPRCSLQYCSRNGSKASCFLPGSVSGLITCGKWPALDKNACPRVVCKILCRLPEKGRICDNLCPDCAFLSLSCESNFELYAPEKCPSEPPLVPDCSLEFCSGNGNTAKCSFGAETITCGEWPTVDPTACPIAVCLILCDLPATGVVCNNTCPPCAFFAASCNTNFKLYAPEVCPVEAASN